MNGTLMLGIWMVAGLAGCATSFPPLELSADHPASSSADQAPRAPELRYLEIAADAASVAQDPMGEDHKGSHPDLSGIGVLAC